MIRRYPVAVFVLVCFAALVLYGCGSGSSSDAGSTTPGPTDAASSTTTATVSGTTPVATGTVSSQIRSVDLKQSAPVQQLLKTTGGQFVQSEVLYGDLTGDGIEEAVVPISSGGTMGDIAYVVLTPSGSGVAAVPMAKGDTTSGGVAVSIDGGRLIDTRPQYGPNDPNCCPTLLRKTTYAWDGQQLSVASTASVPNPDAGVKGTPVATAAGPPVVP
ncbi:MAG TPA: hypothetical protein VIE40_01650 [Dehalococcoidia bacterium]|jgi:hypothetical protein